MSNHSDMGISATIRRSEHHRLQKLDQYHYSAGATSRPLEAAPARYFLDLQIRLGVAVTLPFPALSRRSLGQLVRHSIKRK